MRTALPVPLFISLKHRHLSANSKKQTNLLSKLSERIAVGLARSSVIQNEDVELYAYGFYILISKLLFLIMALIFGVILNIVLETLVFYVLFSIIRAYAGGVHADKEWKCFCYTSISILLCVLGIKLLINLEPTCVYVSMLIASSLLIIIFSPLDTEEKPLSKNEKEKYSIISLLLLLIYLVISLALIITGVQRICYSICVAVSLEAILLSAGKIKQVSNKKKRHTI